MRSISVRTEVWSCGVEAGEGVGPGDAAAAFAQHLAHGVGGFGGGGGALVDLLALEPDAAGDLVNAGAGGEVGDGVDLVERVHVVAGDVFRHRHFEGFLGRDVEERAGDVRVGVRARFGGVVLEAVEAAMAGEHLVDELVVGGATDRVWIRPVLREAANSRLSGAPSRRGLRAKWTSLESGMEALTPTWATATGVLTWRPNSGPRWGVGSRRRRP